MIINPYSFSGATSYYDEVMADSPVVYYRLTETSGNAEDATANNKDGTFVNTPTLDVTGPVTSGKAVTFASASSEYISLAESPIGSSPTAWTLECWVNGAAQSGAYFIAFGSSSDNDPILGIGSGSSGVSQTTSALRVTIRNNTLVNTIGFNAGEAYGTCLDSTWHHVAATYDSGTLKVYVDATEVHSVSGLSPGTISLNRTAIAALLRASAGSYLNGSIAEPAIYTTGLSAARILAHYNAA